MKLTCDVLCDLIPHLYNLKDVKNAYGDVLLLVKLQALSCNFTKITTPPRVFFTFFKLCKWFQIAQSITNFLISFISNTEYNSLSLTFPLGES